LLGEVQQLLGPRTKRDWDSRQGWGGFRTNRRTVLPRHSAGLAAAAGDGGLGLLRMLRTVDGAMNTPSSRS
jgi:hypothetical protein